jgi:hypothetical protein
MPGIVTAVTFVLFRPRSLRAPVTCQRQSCSRSLRVRHRRHRRIGPLCLALPLGLMAAHIAPAALSAPRASSLLGCDVDEAFLLCRERGQAQRAWDGGGRPRGASTIIGPESLVREAEECKRAARASRRRRDVRGLSPKRGRSPGLRPPPTSGVPVDAEVIGHKVVVAPFAACS